MKLLRRKSHKTKMFLLHQKQELAKHINLLDKISKRQIQIDKYFLSEFNLEIDFE